MAHDGSNLLSALSTSTGASDDDLSLGNDLSLSLLDEDDTPLDADDAFALTNIVAAAGSVQALDLLTPAAPGGLATVDEVQAEIVDLDVALGDASLGGPPVLTDRTESSGLSAALLPPQVNPAGSLQTLANYLTDGFWIPRGQTARWYDMSAGYNSGTLYYNVTGWAGNLNTYYGTEADSNGISAARADMVRESFKLYGEILGINFVETTSTATHVDFFFKDSSSGAYSAEQVYAGNGGRVDYTVINVNSGWQSGTSTIGGYTFQTFLHEIGHSLGLGHQGQYNGSGTYVTDAQWANDSWQQTMMSYWDQVENTEYSDDSYAFLISPMAVDWIALQSLYGSQGYGTNNAFNGNTVYGVGTNISTGTSTAFANLATLAASTAFTIIDGDGIDTINFSNYNSNQVIDLFITTTGMTHAWLSSVGGLTKNMTIAAGVVIENATSGGGNDTLWGNDYTNVLTANGGNDNMYGQDGSDTMYGGSGNDYLSQYAGSAYMGGEAGSDTLYGGDGSDTMWGYDGGGTNESDRIYGGNGNDIIYTGTGAETADGGADIDTVYSISSANYNFDMATGATNQTGETFTGFEIAYMGSGNDTVYGGGGEQTIYGGFGNDFINDGSDGSGSGVGDSVYGGDGNDFLQAGDSSFDGDSWYGGSGTDTLSFASQNWGSAPGVAFNFLTGLASFNGFTEAFFSIEIFEGSQGNESIISNGGGQTYYGNDGDDNMSSGLGSETMYGGNGTDTIDHRAYDGNYVYNFATGLTNFSSELYQGYEITYMGDGNDTVTGATGNETVYGGLGNDVVDGDSGSDALYGDDGNDSLNAGDGTDSLYGGSGNDTLSQNFGGPNEILDGGTGTDTADWSYSTFSQWTINLLTGTANLGATTYAVLTSIENVVGGQSTDSIQGNGTGNRIDGQSGNDTINGGGGVDTVLGGDGDDLLIYSFGESYDHFTGGNGNDTVSFNWDSSMTLNLATGIYSDTAFFSPFDLIDIENITKTGTSDDVLLGSAVANNLDAGDGNDSLFGAAGADTLIGGNGVDTLNGGAGNDSLVGGAANDTYFVDSATDVVIETAGGGALDIVRASVSYVLAAAADIEYLSTTLAGGVAAINLTGNGLAQTIYANAGANNLAGDAGNDTIFGLAGSDTLDGGTGNDVMNGGAGDDTFYVDSAADVVFEGAGGGTLDRVRTSVSYALAGGAEVEYLSTTLAGGVAAINLTGNSVAQTLYANAGMNNLNGGGGNDTIFGLAGSDTLQGGTGDDQMIGGADDDWYYVDSAGDIVTEAAGGGTGDRIYASVSYTIIGSAEIELLRTTLTSGVAAINLTGNAVAQTIYGNDGANELSGLAGHDTIFGYDGADRLLGGKGNDLLNGGPGADTFVFDTALGGTNVDTIVGYSVADDMIELDSAIFTGLAAGALNPLAFASNATGLAVLGTDRIIYQSTTGSLFFDADGVGGAAGTKFATLTAGLALFGAGEFWVV